MAPISLSLPRAAAAAGQLSTSLTHLVHARPRSPKPPSLQTLPDIPDSVWESIHHNTPFIPRTISYLSTLLPRSASPQTQPPSSLSKRQSNGIFAIPVSYANLNSGPSPGAVAGIVIGSVFGFLIILYLVYTCCNWGGGFTSFGLFGGGGSTEVIEEEIIRRRSRSPRRRSRSETIEISKSRSPVRRERRPSRHNDDEEDVVEVYEQESSVASPPRRGSKRNSGFRTVDPAEYGGGERPFRKVR